MSHRFIARKENASSPKKGAAWQHYITLPAVKSMKRDKVQRLVHGFFNHFLRRKIKMMPI